MSQQKLYICSVADCGKPGVGRCSQCKVRYCGEDCQADDWPRHMRFCFPLPRLEYPDSDQADRQIIAINGSTTSSNTVIAGNVSVQETLSISPGEQHTTTTKKDGGTDGKDKKEENNNAKAPAQIKEVPKLPEAPVAVQSVTEVGVGNSQPEEKKNPPVVAVESGSSALEVKDVISSTQMASQEVSAGLQDIDPLLPDQIESAAQFSISLAAEGQHYVQLVSLMNDKPPAADSSWTVGRKEPVFALHEDFWQRGLAIKKKGQDYDVFLLDAGETVTVSQDNMRSLPSELRQIPPFLYQVCLAGVAPTKGGKFTEEEIQSFKMVMTDPSYPLMVEFLGQLPGGRWLVRMEGKEDGEDVAKFLVESGVFAAGENPPVTAPNFTERNIQLPVPVQKTVLKGPTITQRLELEEGCEGTVKAMESPGTVLVFPSSRQDLFLSIMEQAQATTLQGEVDPVLGTSCLAKDAEDDLYYRAEILEVKEGKASLFLIDHGKVVEENIQLLKPLPEDLAKEAGLLTKVSIRGLKTLDTWSDEQEEVAKTVMDVGGPTIFRFTEVKLVGSKLCVNATDSEGNDLATFLLGVGLPAENSLDRTSLSPAVLEAGKQEFVVLSAVRPMEIYLSSADDLAAFTEIGCVILDDIGKTADYVHLPKVGQLVLVYKENCWNRAEVVEILATSNILINLLDFPEVLEVEKSQLRQAPKAALEFPVLAAKCALDCFYGKEEEASKQVEKLRSLELDFKIQEGEVVGNQDGLTRVKIPAIESKLVEPVPAAKSSRAAMLKLLKK